MKNYQNEERNSFLTMIKGGYFFLAFPIFIIVSTVFMHVQFAAFWPELLVAVTVTALSLLRGNGKSNREEDDDRRNFRNLLIIVTCSACVIGFTTAYLAPANNFGTIHWIISLAFAAVCLTALWNTGRAISKIQDEEVPYGEMTKFIAIFVTIGMLALAYSYFGTQVIWVPALLLTAFFAPFSSDSDMQSFFNRRRNRVFAELFFLPLIIAVVSTVYQFWFSEIAFGYKLWHVLSLLGSLGVIVLLFIAGKKIAQKISAKKARKLRYAETIEANNAQQAKEAEKTKKIQKEVSDAREAVMSAETPSWKDILLVYIYCELKIDKIASILPKVHLAPLEELVLISTNKQKIVWGPDLTNALMLIEKLAEKSFVDQELNQFKKQVGDFIETLNKYSSFDGYKSTLQAVKHRCKTIIELLPKEVEA